MQVAAWQAAVMAPRASASVTVACSPEVLWDMVADLPRMGEWSPNCKGARWVEPGGPRVGATFIGLNMAGEREYETTNRIVVCERPREIAWEPSFDAGVSWSRWSYRFEPADGQTVVTETWEPLDLERLRGRPVTEEELDKMAERWTVAMQETLARLKAVAEG